MNQLEDNLLASDDSETLLLAMGFEPEQISLLL
jgi:hypothetical protein